MHTLKEILAEPQTMYDGGVVRMADGGDAENISKRIKLKKISEQYGGYTYTDIEGGEWKIEGIPNIAETKWDHWSITPPGEDFATDSANTLTDAKYILDRYNEQAEKEALKLRQKAEQIEVSEEPTGTSLTPYIQGAKKLTGQAVRRIPGVGLIDPSPVADATIPEFMTKILEEKRNKAFEDLAGEQRGNPEVAMLELQKAIGGGVLGNIAEHVGDLTHRMSEKFDQLKGSPISVASKIKSTLKTLRSDYGFEKEYLENIKNNAEFHNIPVEELLNKGNEKLAKYANEHRKLKVYNEPQKWARDAAVAIGEKNWNKAITELEKLEDLLKNPDAYDEAVSKFDEDFDPTKAELGNQVIPMYDGGMVRMADGGDTRETLGYDPEPPTSEDTSENFPTKDTSIENVPMQYFTKYPTRTGPEVQVLHDYGSVDMTTEEYGYPDTPDTSLLPYDIPPESSPYVEPKRDFGRGLKGSDKLWGDKVRKYVEGIRKGEIDDPVFLRTYEATQKGLGQYTQEEVESTGMKDPFLPASPTRTTKTSRQMRDWLSNQRERTALTKGSRWDTGPINPLIKLGLDPRRLVSVTGDFGKDKNVLAFYAPYPNKYDVTTEEYGYPDTPEGFRESIEQSRRYLLDEGDYMTFIRTRGETPTDEWKTVGNYSLHPFLYRLFEGRVGRSAPFGSSSIDEWVEAGSKILTDLTEQFPSYAYDRTAKGQQEREDDKILSVVHESIHRGVAILKRKPNFKMPRLNAAFEVVSEPMKYDYKIPILESFYNNEIWTRLLERVHDKNTSDQANVKGQTPLMGRGMWKSIFNNVKEWYPEIPRKTYLSNDKISDLVDDLLTKPDIQAQIKYFIESAKETRLERGFPKDDRQDMYDGGMVQASAKPMYDGGLVQ